MVGKLFKTVVCVLSIGVLQYFTVLGCQTNSDCATQTTTGSRKQCCHHVVPPRCMDWLVCYLSRPNDNTQRIPTFSPKFTLPDYIRFTPPDFNRFTVPDYNRFTVPDNNRLTAPNFNSFADYNPQDKLNMPTYSYNNNDDYNDDNDSSSSGVSSGGVIGTVVATILLSIIIFSIRCLVRYRPMRNHFRAATSTSRTNLVAQQNREPRRIVIISVTRNEDQINRRQNQPPDGEPPFLSDEDILHNLHHSCAQEPPPYEEGTTGPHLPKYEDLVNSTMDLTHPTYPEVQEPSQTSMSSSQITPPIQQNQPIPDTAPPPYEDVQAAASNEAVDPLP